MLPWPPHVYRTIGEEQGLPPELIRSALEQAHHVQRNHKIPAILTLNHLARSVDVAYASLRSVIQRTLPNPYRLFRIQKRRGGYRTICVPHPDLFRTQKWLAREVLSRLPAHRCSFAYGPSQSTLECARLHCGCRWLMKVDVRQFFESISERQVFHVFASAGYQRLVAFELARICTRLAKPWSFRYTRLRWRNVRRHSHRVNLPYDHAHVGHLPQGAPTSPMLSNLSLIAFDGVVESMACEYDLLYTRYADDLIFSTSAAVFGRSQVSKFLGRLFELMRAHGLRPRNSKTVVAPPGARKVVLGLLVDTDRPRLPRRFRAKLEQHVYLLDRFGPSTHAQHRGFRSLFAMKSHIGGLLSYARHVDPAFAAPLLSLFAGVDWP